MKVAFKSTFLFFLFFNLSIICNSQQKLLTAAEQFPKYIKFLENENVGIVANKASFVYKNNHIVDSLISLGIIIKKVFVPEHGFRVSGDAGEKNIRSKRY